jgi:EmrB/QacA subfamily drug resistance transporter
MNPWVPSAVVLTGGVMTVLDATIVNVALHRIGQSFDAGNGIEWVVSAYLLAVCVSMPVTGWLADRFGRKIVFLASLATFTAASALCALAQNLPALVGARVLQGLGGGAVIPVGMAVLLDLFPASRHGRVMGAWGMAINVAPAIGPTLGGWLVTAVSWHWLFIVNVPIGLACVAAGVRLLPNGRHTDHRPFDFPGLALGCGGLAATVLGLSEANQWGWSSPATVGCLVGGVGALGWFVRHELAVPNPMIDLRMFSQRTFRLAVAIMLLTTFAQYGRLVFMALELEGLHGYTPLRVGLIFLPGAIAATVGMRVGGVLADRIGPRPPILVGSAFMIAGLVGLSTLRLDTSLTVITVWFCLQGFGIGLLNPAASVAGLNSLPRALLGQFTAVRSLSAQVSGALSVASLGAVIAARSGANPSDERLQHAYNSAFMVCVLGLVVALALAWRLPSSHRQRSDERPPSAGR